MLNIERMRIQLPGGYEHRASLIANLVGESLAGYQPLKSQQLDSLTIGPVHVMSNSTDKEIADKIAHQIKDTLGSRL